MIIKKLLFLCFIPFLAYGQHGEVVFEKETHDIGRIYKTRQPIVHEFKFKNKGKSPVTILNVVPDCACATVSYTTTPIYPNEKGSIKVSFLPYKAGAFEKSFAITTDGSPQHLNLRLRGYLVPTSSIDLNNIYAHKNGKMRFKHKNLNLGTISARFYISKKFEFYNASQEDITFTERMITPPHIKVFFDSSLVIKAGKTGAIVIAFDPRIKKSIGYFYDNVVLFTTDSEQPQIELNVVTHVEDENLSTSNISENTPTRNVSKQPKIRFSETVQYLGNVYPESEITTEFVVYNEGGVDLQIKGFETSEGCEVLINKGEVLAIAPDEYRIIRVKFKPLGTAGKQTRLVNILSNDPQNSKQTLEVVGTVIEK